MVAVVDTAALSEAMSDEHDQLVTLFSTAFLEANVALRKTHGQTELIDFARVV